MTKGRSVTFEENVEIVQVCIADGNDYMVAIEKYQISYQQIYSWVRKYESGGVTALADRRGKPKVAAMLSEADRLGSENKLLEAKIKWLEMENNLLKMGGDRKKVVLNRVHLTVKYKAVKELHEEKSYTRSLNVSKYYHGLESCTTSTMDSLGIGELQCSSTASIRHDTSTSVFTG